MKNSIQFFRNPDASMHLDLIILDLLVFKNHFTIIGMAGIIETQVGTMSYNLREIDFNEYYWKTI